MPNLTNSQKAQEWNRRLEEMPIATNDEMEIVADLAMQELYKVFRERGGRELKFCTSWAAVAGYRIPAEKVPAFSELCKAKWRLIIKYIETEYQHR